MVLDRNIRSRFWPNIDGTYGKNVECGFKLYLFGSKYWILKLECTKEEFVNTGLGFSTGGV